MAHLTASPFHKPSPFEFPQRSTSTDSANNQLPTPASLSVLGPQEHSHPAEYFDTSAASISAEVPAAARFRRAASSIVYHNSGLRESRERTVQRSSRSFLVVLPPPSLPQDHVHLGHTLSSGPRNRLAQGLLMPLFPTMYAQLQAIAREFNFPSTTGLCLYLHVNENGITATPRIADDSWQLIWGHAFDPAQSPTAHHLLPICGKIEFDIDLRLARWYGAWMAMSHREHVDVPMSVTPSAAPSVVHYREESRTTFADNDDQDNRSVARAPTQRHVPRMLSLVDRFDAMSARSVPRSVTRPPPVEPLPSSQNLSPIFQEDEPKTAKLDLEHRVKSWRASASVDPDATAQILLAGGLLAGAHLPGSPLDESPRPTTSDEQRDEPEEDEYRIEDYSFSISSAGPGDYDPYSPLTWFYDASVHIANRAQGSVCMTPTDCTSFGPSDYTLSPYVPTFDLDAVRTPDIAHRMFEDVPPSPSIATSWGAPSYPPSPVAYSRAPSVHLGDRGCFSRPMTPMTATSWGAPESFPPSPTTPFYVRTPDAGQRAFDLSALSEHDAPWNLVWPYHDATRPWAHVWPHQPGAIEQAEEGASSLAEVIGAGAAVGGAALAIGLADRADNVAEGAAPWNMVWPYHDAARPWAHVWPHQSGAIGLADRADSVAEHDAPWNMVWPYHARDVGAAAVPWNMTWPYYRGQATPFGQMSVQLPAAYPSLNIYPAVYPYNLDEIYPAQNVDADTEITTTLAAYPCLNIYPAVYPSMDIYPAVSCSWAESSVFFLERGPLTISLSAGPAIYPGNLASIYPAPGIDSLLTTSAVFADCAVYYPFFNIYPATSPRSREISDHVTSWTYPCLDIYPAVYPNFCLYPAVSGAWTDNDDAARGPLTIRLAAGDATYPGHLDEIYPPQTAARVLSGAAAASGSLVIRLAAGPAVYPGHLDEIYPSRSATGTSTEKVLVGAAVSIGLAAGLAAYSGRPNATSADSSEILVNLAPRYPAFDIYPATYPWNLQAIYAPSAVFDEDEISTQLASVYPYLNIYPAVYPNLEIYPSLSCESAEAVSQTAASVCYPYFDLYPAVAASSSPKTTRQRGVSISLRARYPALNLYDAVYPHVAPYPPIAGEMEVPEFQVVYPHFDLYPAVATSSRKTSQRRKDNTVSITLKARYPAFNLYDPVYPHVIPYPALEGEMAAAEFQVVYPYFDLYPAVSAAVASSKPAPRETQYVHAQGYPIFNLYPAVYPHVEPYPPFECEMSADIDIQLESRYPYLQLYEAVYPHFEIYGQLSSMAAPRPPLQSRFTRSDLHALMMKANEDKIRKTHQDLHLALFPRGVNVSTPSGTPHHVRKAGKSHLDLHLAVFPDGVVPGPSESDDVPTNIPAITSTPARVATRLRSGSVLRNSLPPSPRPVGGRPLSVRAPTTTVAPPPPAPAEGLRRSVSSATRPSPDRVASRVSTLTRSTSMALPSSDRTPPGPPVTAPRVAPRKRDSLVLQRVKALQGGSPIKEDEPSFPPPPPRPATFTRRVIS